MLSTNIRDERNQPVETASPVRIRYYEPEEEAPNFASEPKEEANSEQEQERNYNNELESEAGPNDTLEYFETRMAEVLENINISMQPGGPLGPSIMETQVPENSGHIETLPSPEAADTEIVQESNNHFGDKIMLEHNHEDQKKSADIEVSHESNNQSGDTVLLEHNPDDQQIALETIDKPISGVDAPQKSQGVREKLKKLWQKYRKLQKMVRRLR